MSHELLLKNCLVVTVDDSLRDLQDADVLSRDGVIITVGSGLSTSTTDAEVIDCNLIEATQWPTWYSNSADIRIEGGQSKLAKGVSFTRKTYGFPIKSTVDVFGPDREIGWGR
jgi:hypothetical protein